MRFLWKRFSVCVLSFIIVSRTFGVLPELCRQEIAGLVKTGPGWGFIYLPDVQATAINWARRGLKDGVSFGGIYLCDSCGRPNSTRDSSAKLIQCKGCPSHINTKTQFHRIWTQGGLELMHIEGTFYGKEDVLSQLAMPWACSYCQNKNDHDTKTCASCGAPPYAKEAGTIPQGVDLILIPDPNVLNGYRLEPRVSRAQVFSRHTGQAVRAATARASERVSPLIAAAAPYIGPVVLPVADRLNQLSRRQFWSVMGASTLALAGFTWWWTLPYVPEISGTVTERGTVTGREMFRARPIYEKKNGDWVLIDPNERYEFIRTPEKSDSRGMIPWPKVALEVERDTNRYRVGHHEEHILHVETRSYQHSLGMSASQMEQWRVGDRGQVIMDEGSALLGISKEEK